jgi:hypothetical protein
MTPSATRPDPRRHTGRGLFARLEAELVELGFEPSPDSQPSHTVYTATDSQVLVIVTDEPGRARVQVRVRCGPDTAWGLDWTAQMPHVKQLIALYLALNDDAVAAIDAAAAAIGTDTATEAIRHNPAAD